MKISDLRALASYHAQIAQHNREAARGMNAPASAEFIATAALHEQWAQQLRELANAFEVLGLTQR